MAAALLGAFALAGSSPVQAQGLLPASFFNAPIDQAAPTAVEANELIFDQAHDTITANGDVVLSVSGYVLTGDHLVYRRGAGAMDLTGNVTVTDPSGNVSRSDTLKLTEKFRMAFLEALAITSNQGALVTADSADYDKVLQTILVNAGYAPCGECIDAKGRRIGWSVNASRVVYHADDGSVSLEQPTLSLLGVPVAWLPYLWMPDLSNSALADVPRPTLAYGEKFGVKAEIPFSVHSTRNTSIILTPTLMSGQGFLLGAEWIQRFDSGSFRIKASGLYQFNKDAFAGTVGHRDWRGAIQASGEFVPLEDWKLGAAYAAFTDSTYFEDYQLNVGRAAINEVYATHLTADTYIDARVQQYNQLGASEASREQQGMALPNIRVEKRFVLPEGAGQIDLEARLLGISRTRDSRTVIGGAPGIPGVPYANGYSGNRLHGMTQASWHNQMIGGGAVMTPFLGLRADIATYDGNSPLATAPASQVLWGLTPIAALDMRYPLVAASPGIVHLVEPVAQLVYRGAQSIAPGITNEDSQSIAFDDANLFSYNRFTGIDRQETGLRANIGGRYLASFDNGSHFELVAGQSFQLAGLNAFAEPNDTQVGVGSGLDVSPSYGVLGAYASIGGSTRFGGKVQIDSASFDLARASFGASYAVDGLAASLDYRYAAAVPAAGVMNDQHEIGGDVKLGIADYWSITGKTYWDLRANSYLLVGGGLIYDDGYLEIGASASRSGPTHTSPNDTRLTATFRLKTPAGFDVGYSGAVPAPSF